MRARWLVAVAVGGLLPVASHAAEPTALYPHDGAYGFEFPSSDEENRGYRFTAAADIDIVALAIEKTTFESCAARLYDNAGSLLASGTIVPGFGFLTWLESELRYRLHAGSQYTLSTYCVDSFLFEGGAYLGGEPIYDQPGLFTSLTPVFDTFDGWPLISDVGESRAMRVVTEALPLNPQDRSDGALAIYDGPRGVSATAARDIFLTRIEVYGDLPVASQCDLRVWDALTSEPLAEGSSVVSDTGGPRWQGSNLSLSLLEGQEIVLGYECDDDFSPYLWEASSPYPLDGDFTGAQGVSGGGARVPPASSEPDQPRLRLIENVIELRDPTSTSVTPDAALCTDCSWGYRFTPTRPIALDAFEVFLAGNGATVEARVWDVATEAELAASPATVIGAPVHQWVRFDFPASVALEAGVTYAVSMSVTGATVDAATWEGGAQHDIDGLVIDVDSVRDLSGAEGFPAAVNDQHLVQRLVTSDSGIDCDVDGDGFETERCLGLDCDDDDPDINPDALEIPGDEIDQDCDGVDAMLPGTGSDSGTDGSDTDDSGDGTSTGTRNESGSSSDSGDDTGSETGDSLSTTGFGTTDTTAASDDGVDPDDTGSDGATTGAAGDSTGGGAVTDGVPPLDGGETTSSLGDGSGSTDTSDAAQSGDDSGCACRSAPGRGGRGQMLWLAFLAGLRRRRSRPAEAQPLTSAKFSTILSMRPKSRASSGLIHLSRSSALDTTSRS